MKPLVNKNQTCLIDGCTNPAKCRGWCMKHYTKFHTTGDPLKMKRVPYGEAECSVEGCCLLAKENAMCAKHAQRVRRYGDANYVTPEQVRREHSREANLRPAKATSYRKRLGRHEHRVVAEQMLGRPLAKGEIVHHVDGNKHNNAPENLKVMSQSEHMREHLPEMQEALRRVRAKK